MYAHRVFISLIYCSGANQKLRMKLRNRKENPGANSKRDSTRVDRDTRGRHTSTWRAQILAKEWKEHKAPAHKTVTE